MDTHHPPEKPAPNKKKVEDEDDDFWGSGPWLDVDAAGGGAPAGQQQPAISPAALAAPASTQPGGFVIAEQNPFLASAAAPSTEWDFEDIDEAPAGQAGASLPQQSHAPAEAGAIPARAPALSPAAAASQAVAPALQHPSPQSAQPVGAPATQPSQVCHPSPLCTQPQPPHPLPTQTQQPVIQQHASQPQLPGRHAEPDPDSFFDSLGADTEPELQQVPPAPQRQHLGEQQPQESPPVVDVPEQQQQQPAPADSWLEEQHAGHTQAISPQAVPAAGGAASSLCSPFARTGTQEQVEVQQACDSQALDQQQQQQQQQLAGQLGTGAGARHRLATAFYPSPSDALTQQGSISIGPSPAGSYVGPQGHSIKPASSARDAPAAHQQDPTSSGHATGLGADQQCLVDSTSQQMHAYAAYYAQYFSSQYGPDHYNYYYSLCAQQFQLQLQQQQQQGAAAALDLDGTHSVSHQQQELPQQQHLTQQSHGMHGAEAQQHGQFHSHAWCPPAAAPDHTPPHSDFTAHPAMSAGVLSSMPNHSAGALLPACTTTHSSFLPGADSSRALPMTAFAGHQATTASIPMHVYGTSTGWAPPHSLPGATPSFHSFHTPLPAPAMSHADVPQSGLGQGGNLYSKQYDAEHKLCTPGALVDLPTTQHAARACPNGRPAHPFVSFGFGGSILVVRTSMQTEAISDHAGLHAAPAALLTFTSLPRLHAALMEGPQEAFSATSPSASQPPDSNGHLPFGTGRLLRKSVLGVIKGQHHDKQGMSSEDPTLKVLTAFPGPLGSGTSKEAVLKFIADREAAYPAEDPHASLGPEGVGRMIWQALGVMVKHDGLLKGASSKKPLVKPGALAAEQELVHMLNSWRTTESAARPNPAVAASLSGAASVPPLLGPPQDDMRQQAAAEEVQRLVVQGKQQEAVKVAMQAQLWGIALCLAQGCGERVASETATAMAYACMVPGCPLRTLVLLLAGHAEQAVSPHDHSVQEGTMAPGMRDGQGVLLNSWRENLAVLASSARSPADLDAIVQLGDRLALEGAQVQAAHLCYLVAGLLPSPYDFRSTASAHCKPASLAPAGAAPGGLAHYCLLGVDHVNTPRTYAHPLAIQRTEIFEWARSLMNTGSKPASAPGHSPSTSMPDLTAAGAIGSLPSLLPYKLVHACMLAEYGRIQDALAYCQALEACFRASIPAGRMSLMARELEAFKERLLNFAAAHSINVSRSESSITKVGRILDSTLNKLLWGAQEHAVPSGQPKKVQEPTPHPRNPTVTYGGPDAPVAPLNLGTNMQSRCSTPGASQGHNSLSMLSRPPSGAMYNLSGCTSHASSACESHPPEAPSQDMAVQNGTSNNSHPVSAPSPTLIPKPSSCSILSGLEHHHSPPSHSPQASMDTIPAHTSPHKATSQLHVMNQSMIARSSSSPSLEPSHPTADVGLQHADGTAASPGLPPLPPKSDERKSKSQAATPGKSAEKRGAEARPSWGLMGILSASSKRIGSVVAQGKEAVAAKSKQEGGPNLESLGEEKKGFYYDHGRKRWVIEGEEEEQEEHMPPPPPKLALGHQGLCPPGSPPMPPHGAPVQGAHTQVPPIPCPGDPSATHASGAAAHPHPGTMHFRRGAGTSRYVDPMFSGSSIPSHQSSSSSIRNLLPGSTPQASGAQHPPAFFTPVPAQQPQVETQPVFQPMQKGQEGNTVQQLQTGGVQESVAQSLMGLGSSGKSDEMKEVEL